MNKRHVPTLPFIIQVDNVARYEDGEVMILDRRIYPFEIKYVRCKTYEEVADAIRSMVTQSDGPGYAAGYAMVQAAHKASGLSAEGISAELERAAAGLAGTRPTYNHVRRVVSRLLEVGREAIQEGRDVEAELLSAMRKVLEQRLRGGMVRGKAAADLLEDGDTLLVHCWAESGIVYTIMAALEQGKTLQAYCTETRPYLQGARLTADAIGEMGVPVTVVTDGMPGYLFSRGLISKFFAGADRVTMDGHVINKIGTFQIALCAHHFGVPFYTFCFGPDPHAPTADAVTIEERDPLEVLHCMGHRTATPRAKGYYPAFDVTPPEYVSALLTDRGVFSPYAAADYFKVKTEWDVG